MAEAPEEQLRGALASAVRAHVVPAAALAVGRRERHLACLVAGAATEETLFDLASLTKVTATTPAVLSLAEAGRLALDDPVARHVPAFGGHGRDSVTIRHLLTHTAGLPASRRYYRSHATAEAMREAVLSERLEHPPGSRVVYSDLGFLLLGEVIEAVTGDRLDTACADLVHRPLRMTDTGYRPLEGRARATTDEPEDGGSRGVPHDRNARLADGIAGHAGLFSTIGDVARFAAWWTSTAAGPVSATGRRDALRCRTEGLGGRRGWGWVARGDRDDFLPDGWPATAAVHTGFTGTSLAVDAVTGWWVCLLTNAVHLGRNRPAVDALRTEVHRLAVPLLQAVHTS